MVLGRENGGKEMMPSIVRNESRIHATQIIVAPDRRIVQGKQEARTIRNETTIRPVFS